MALVPAITKPPDFSFLPLWTGKFNSVIHSANFESVADDSGKETVVIGARNSGFVYPMHSARRASITGHVMSQDVIDRDTDAYHARKSRCRLWRVVKDAKVGINDHPFTSFSKVSKHVAWR